MSAAVTTSNPAINDTVYHCCNVRMIFLLTDFKARTIYPAVYPWLSLKMATYTREHPALCSQSTNMLSSQAGPETFRNSFT
jgi:hypothetical protein